MPAKKYIVTLTADERNVLYEIINKGKHNAQKRKRAQALLLAEQAYTDDMIAERSGMSRRGLEQLRQRFVEEGFEVTLEGKPKGHRPKALNGADEARLIALVCSPKPEGKSRWTLRLLQDTWSTEYLSVYGDENGILRNNTTDIKKTKLNLGGARNGA